MVATLRILPCRYPICMEIAGVISLYSESFTTSHSAFTQGFLLDVTVRSFFHLIPWNLGKFLHASVSNTFKIVRLQISRFLIQVRDLALQCTVHRWEMAILQGKINQQRRERDPIQ